MKKTTSQTQMSKDIKRLNERLRDFERKGLQHTEEYKRFVSSIAKLPTHTTKKSDLAITNTTKMTEYQQHTISNLVNRESTQSGKVLKKYEKLLKEQFPDKKPTKEQVKQYANKSGKLHDLISNNLGTIYSNQSLNNIVVGNNGKLTVEEVDELFKELSNEVVNDISNYNEEFNKMSYQEKEMFHNSSEFYNLNVHGINVNKKTLEAWTRKGWL